MFELAARQFHVDGGGLCRFQLAFRLRHIGVGDDTDGKLVFRQPERFGQQGFAFFQLFDLTVSDDQLQVGPWPFAPVTTV